MSRYLDPESFTVVKAVSESPDGKVSVVSNTTTKEKYRLKELKYGFSNHKNQITFTRTIEVLKDMNHPAVNEHVGYWLENALISRSNSFVTKYEPNGSLEDVLKATREGCAPKWWDDTRKIIHRVDNHISVIVGCQRPHQSQSRPQQPQRSCCQQTTWDS